MEKENQKTHLDVKNNLENNDSINNKNGFIEKTNTEDKEDKCKKYDKILIYLTGYGPFMCFKTNPSQQLVDLIAKCKEKIEKELGNKIIFEQIEVMKVECDHVDERLKDIKNSIIKNKNNKEMKLLINIGLNSDIKKPVIHLETTSRNYINDRKTRNGKIVNCENLELKTKLNLCGMIENSDLAHSAELSTDAGDYLCNFAFYSSNFALQDQPSCYAEFIHIPLPIVLSTEDCLKCFIEFLKQLESTYLIKE